MRVAGDVKGEPEERNENGLPEADNFHVAEQGNVIQVALFREGDGTAEQV